MTPKSTCRVSNLEFEIQIHELDPSVGQLRSIAIRVDAHAMVAPATLNRVSQDDDHSCIWGQHLVSTQQQLKLSHSKIAQSIT